MTWGSRSNTSPILGNLYVASRDRLANGSHDKRLGRLAVDAPVVSVRPKASITSESDSAIDVPQRLPRGAPAETAKWQFSPRIAVSLDHTSFFVIARLTRKIKP